MRIDYANLARLDLNLLVALDALLSERSVTRAAGRIGVSQSAMSHSLARLRTVFGDELLTRAPDGMKATPRALGLVQPLRALLVGVESLTSSEDAFDPATADMSFSLGIPDSTEVMLIPQLVLKLQTVAPGIRLLLRTVDRTRILDDLDSGRVDLGIGVFEQGQTHHKRLILRKENYLCIFNGDLVGLQPPISLEDYLRLPHMLTSLVESSHGVVDDALARIGKKRHIALTSPRFAAAPFVLMQAPIIATMHSRLAMFFAGNIGLQISPLPIELPDVQISMIWHSSNDRSPSHRWLRETITSLRYNELVSVFGA